MKEIATKRWEFEFGNKVLTITDEAVARDLDRLQRAEVDRDKWAAAWDRLREALTTIIVLAGPSSHIADIAAKALAGGKDDDH